MTNFIVDYTYALPVYDSVTVDADDYEQAEQFALDYINDTYTDAKHIEIESVKELNAPADKELPF